MGCQHTSTVHPAPVDNHPRSSIPENQILLKQQTPTSGKKHNVQVAWRHNRNSPTSGERSMARHSSESDGSSLSSARCGSGELCSGPAVRATPAHQAADGVPTQKKSVKALLDASTYSGSDGEIVKSQLCETPCSGSQDGANGVHPEDPDWQKDTEDDWSEHESEGHLVVACMAPVWAVYDPKEGEWIPYTESQNVMLEAVYLNNPQGSCELEIDGTTVEIKFAEMREYGSDEGRYVRRVQPTAPVEEVVPAEEEEVYVFLICSDESTCFRRTFASAVGEDTYE